MGLLKFGVILTAELSQFGGGNGLGDHQMGNICIHKQILSDIMEHFHEIRGKTCETEGAGFDL